MDLLETCGVEAGAQSAVTCDQQLQGPLQPDAINRSHVHLQVGVAGDSAGLVGAGAPQQVSGLDVGEGERLVLVRGVLGQGGARLQGGNHGIPVGSDGLPELAGQRSGGRTELQSTSFDPQHDPGIAGGGYQLGRGLRHVWNSFDGIGFADVWGITPDH